MSKKTITTLIIIVFIGSFFVTPLGYWGKLFLMQIFAKNPEIISVSQREKIAHYNWKLKDANWNFFNFEKSKGKVVFIKFWASWHLPSISELNDIQELYDAYCDKIDFYIITNEERAPIEEFMNKNTYTFKVTYLIIDEPAPIEVLDPPASYIIDANGFVVVKEEKNADWNNTTIITLLNTLISE